MVWTIHHALIDGTSMALVLEELGLLLQGLPLPPFESSYFLSRETVVSTPDADMAQWREKLFATMNHNASGVVAFFHLPDNAVVELGTRVQI